MRATPTETSPRPAPLAVADAAHRLRVVHRSLARLDALDSLPRLISAAPREACVACDLDRAMLTHLRGGRLSFAAISSPKMPQLAADFGRLARALRPRLADAPAEHEAATKQEPVIVRDAQRSARVYRPLVHFSRSDCYVVVPVVQNGVTIALLHADRIGGRPLDAFDAELLATFATGLSLAMRLVVGARRTPTEDYSGAWLDEALAELTRSLTPAPAAEPPPLPVNLPPIPSPMATLTSREREVLNLMAGGASNATIAAALVISSATVKSHVRHILRKLAASNRTEAVSRYHALSGGAAGPFVRG